MIPIVDLFAGPGGLGEGFAAFRASAQHPFRVTLSIEKDMNAHVTLELRGFFRHFRDVPAPALYYQHLRGSATRAELFLKFPEAACEAAQVAWQAELGVVAPDDVDRRIREAIGKSRRWVLVGGPPCQAYSIVGRSRRSKHRKKWASDARHYLYKEYLRVIAQHQPAAFVLENVKGLLSTSLNGSNIFQDILADLRKPIRVAKGTAARRGQSPYYRLYSFSDAKLFEATDCDTSRFVVCCENHGIPQCRHRVIILGVRDDIDAEPSALSKLPKTLDGWQAIAELPPIRGILSREPDSAAAWLRALRGIRAPGILSSAVDPVLRGDIEDSLTRLDESLDAGGEFVSSGRGPKYRKDWFFDEHLGGVCNHSGRAHIARDFQRYLYAACFARINGLSPHIADFPPALRPNHKNVKDAIEKRVFADRFRVQLEGRPATTVTCHIAKDGHYFIHPDPTQCRSFTVREAARVQTFPDNYFFCGPRTAQYQQVGNAVPPLLAIQLAEIVHRIIHA